ncbi:hypothetical protein Q6348_01310 [Isoptericola sp. b441]|uniref:Succinate dehydrogenase n=1 Tax=Actinotalea lenta TaxID=3064654 RepID=A0ABT9D525_9CELL|nr:MULTISPECIES: hypothetical protein [unclassified Isoptericola]MDO8105832.1 hypothetical protein [Isoptericola sp. b441]MDO8122537.1 hypothetical protein [Isoptericola sp. b490]
MAVDVRHRTPHDRVPATHGRRAALPGRGGTGGAWGWLLQVVTGVALLVLVVVHLVAQHFVVDAPAGLRDHASVVAYLSSPVILVIEAAFLLAVTWHAMLGVRAILLDLGPRERGRRRITVGVSALGVATLGYGAWLLIALAT